MAIAIDNTTATLTAARHITTTFDATLQTNAINTIAAMAVASGALKGEGQARTKPSPHSPPDLAGGISVAIAATRTRQRCATRETQKAQH